MHLVGFNRFKVILMFMVPYILVTRSIQGPTRCAVDPTNNLGYDKKKLVLTYDQSLGLRPVWRSS
jgi:hypothetical protein